MKSIYKYELEITDTQQILMPKFPEVLHVGIQNNKLCIWVLVSKTGLLLPKTFYIYGTGHDLDDAIARCDHLGTVQMDQFVWHVFEDR